MVYIASDKCTDITKGTKKDLYIETLTCLVGAEKPTKLICGDMTQNFEYLGCPAMKKHYMATNTQGTVLQDEPSKTSSP